MSGVKHTPGPWKAHKTIEAHDGMPECWQIDAEHDAVCTTQFCYAPNTEANARLIASAPDLLEALEAHQGVSQLLAELEFCLDEERGEIERQLRDIEEQARAAIARARGEQDGGGED